MHRIRKLLGIIFILCVVSFIICDEKGIKIEFQDGKLVFNETEKKSEINKEELDANVVYKNSDIIHLNYEFKNPKNLRNSDGMDPHYLAKLEQEKKKIEEDRRRQVYTGPNIVSIDDKNSISSFFKPTESGNENKQQENTGTQRGYEEESDISTGLVITGETTDINTGNSIVTGNDETSVKMIPVSSLKKYEPRKHSISLGKLVKIPEIAIETGYSVIKYRPQKHHLSLNKGTEIIKTVQIDKYKLSQHSLDLELGKEPPKVRIRKYRLRNTHSINLRTGVAIVHEFVVEDQSRPTGNIISDDMMETLLMNEEINVDTLESEDDEFLQKVFLETKDTDIMNLIVETYLSEYQFVKAKKFIEELPEIYLDSLKPSLNLRVAFNSFSLSSKTSNVTLTSLIQNYKSKNQISDEDGNWYLGVIALMQRNYNGFFTIANSFTSENHQSFTAKLQGYKDQISKQMGMPEYYFDTLVALELFNQGLFQPAKVLALYSLQQNSNYILPYQILAYANFLTNSRDTSIEYLKKLVDLDPTNAEKYQFLMGVAYYWNEKYEQSVIMLSMIQNDNLRLDAERYLIRDYLFLDQRNKLILSWNKMLGYDNLVDSDFYTYFYEVFYRPYSEGSQYQLYAIDTDLADKMIRLCAVRLPKEENVVCNYGSIGKNIALGKFEGLEDSLLKLATEYPQGYLYQALGEYYLQQGDSERAKIYLLKAVSLAQNKSERSQIKKLLQESM